jgi:hypothetical protein
MNQTSLPTTNLQIFYYSGKDAHYEAVFGV